MFPDHLIMPTPYFKLCGQIIYFGLLRDRLPLSPIYPDRITKHSARIMPKEITGNKSIRADGPSIAVRSCKINCCSVTMFLLFYDAWYYHGFRIEAFMPCLENSAGFFPPTSSEPPQIRRALKSRISLRAGIVKKSIKKRKGRVSVRTNQIKEAAIREKAGQWAKAIELLGRIDAYGIDQWTTRYLSAFLRDARSAEGEKKI